MPARDGTGPAGIGPMGGVFGFCNLNVIGRVGLGRGFKRGYRYFALEVFDGKADKELLEARKETLKSQLEQINKKLEKL